MDREDASRRWQTDPETTTSGGHLASGSGASGPLFDALDAPLPSEVEAERRVRRRSEEATAAATVGATEVLPQRRTPTPRRRSPARDRRSRKSTVRRTSASRVGARRVRRTVKHIQPFSVLKVSLILYSVFLILWLIFVAVIYSFVDSAGLFETLESFGRGMALWENVDISLGLVERWAFFIGLGLVVVGSLINLFLAFLYNVISDIVGGVELTFQERDQRDA